MGKLMSCLLAVLALSDCGGQALDTPGNAAKFDGTWTHSGSLSAACGSTFSYDLAGDMQCTPAGGSDLECSFQSPACTWTFTVSGADTAKIKSGQTCSVEQSGVTIALSPKNWTMKLASDGTSAEETGDGTAIATVPGLGQIPCTFTASATMTKAP